MSFPPPFLLSRVKEDDMDRILDLQYDCFPPHLCVIFMGCHSKADLPKLRDKYVQQMKDPSDIWVKVEDSATGDLVAASNWKVHINGASKEDSPDEVPEGIEGDDLKESQRIISLFNTKRGECNPGPFLHLHICFTHPSYRRRGAGGMMMKWGCELADLMELPGWIEASDEGNFLYKTFGFYDYIKYSLDEEPRGTGMRRDPKSISLKGGK